MPVHSKSASTAKKNGSGSRISCLALDECGDGRREEVDDVVNDGALQRQLEVDARTAGRGLSKRATAPPNSLRPARQDWAILLVRLS